MSDALGGAPLSSDVRRRDMEHSLTKDHYEQKDGRCSQQSGRYLGPFHDHGGPAGFGWFGGGISAWIGYLQLYAKDLICFPIWTPRRTNRVSQRREFGSPCIGRHWPGVAALNVRFMRRLSSIQKGALVLAAVLVVGGALMALFPTAVVRTHPAETTDAGVYFPGWTEHISKSGARLLGVLAAALGVAIAWFSTRRDDESATDI